MPAPEPTLSKLPLAPVVHARCNCCAKPFTVVARGNDHAFDALCDHFGYITEQRSPERMVR